MSHPRRWFAAVLLLGVAPLGGCSSVRGRCDPCRPTGRVERSDPWAAAARAHGRGEAAVWSYLAAKYDHDGDGRVTVEEHPRGETVVRRLDRDKDGSLGAADFTGATVMANYITALVLERIAAKPPPADEAEDRKEGSSDDDMPTPETLTRAFTTADRDGSGTLLEAEVDAALRTATRTPVPDVPDLPAGVRPFPFLLESTDADGSRTVTLPEVLAWRTEQAERRAAAMAAAAAAAASAEAEGRKRPEGRPRRPEAPAVGTPAPDFTLRSRGGTTTRTLSDLRGTPVVLVFGSYSCPPFRASAPWIRAAWDRHGRDVRFLFVYVREAHAIDGRAPMPDADQPIVEEPGTFDDRRAVADACALRLRFGVFETLVDDLDDTVARAYAAPPARLFVLARDGTVAWRSGPGPFGLKQQEFEAALRDVLAPPAP